MKILPEFPKHSYTYLVVQLSLLRTAPSVWLNCKDISIKFNIRYSYECKEFNKNMFDGQPINATRLTYIFSYLLFCKLNLFQSFQKVFICLSLLLCIFFLVDLKSIFKSLNIKKEVIQETKIHKVIDYFHFTNF